MNKMVIKTMLMFALAMVVGSVWAEVPGQDSGYSINTASWVELNRFVQMPESMDSENFTVLVQYTSGDQRTNIDQVELIDPAKNEVLAVDDHDGYSGINTEDNLYSFFWNDSYAGKMLLLRLKIRCDQAGSSTGYIRLSNGVVHYKPSSFGINFTGADDQNLDALAKIGFTKDSYELPMSWVNVRGGASVSSAIDCAGSQLYVSCSSRGTYNSGIGVESDFGKLTREYLDDAVNSC